MNAYCTYITFYHGNKLHPFYIGSSSINKIKKGYKGSVASKDYREIWLYELKHNIHLFRTYVITTHETKAEESNVH